MKSRPLPLLAAIFVSVSFATAKDVTTIYREQAERNAAAHAAQNAKDLEARVNYNDAKRRIEERERQREGVEAMTDKWAKERKEKEIEERFQREVARRLALEKQAAAQDPLPPLSEQIKTWSVGAEKGDAQSQINMAWCYHDGTGVPKDDRKALMWFTLASEASGLPELRKIVAELDATMPLARVNEAREMIRIWKKARNK